MGQFFDPVRGLCYYGTSTLCTGPPSAPTGDVSPAVNSSLHPTADVSRDTNDVGFSRYSIELNSKEVLPGKCLEGLPTALPLGYCVGICCKWGSCVTWWICVWDLGFTQQCCWAVHVTLSRRYFLTFQRIIEPSSAGSSYPRPVFGLLALQMKALQALGTLAALSGFTRRSMKHLSVGMFWSPCWSSNRLPVKYKS